MKTLEAIGLFALVIVGFGCAGSGSVGRPAHRLPAALDHGRSGHCIESVDGEIVLFGGWHDQEGSAAKKETMVFDPKTRAWQSSSPLNSSSYFAASVVVDNVIYSLGRVIERWDARNRNWEVVLSDQRLPRSHFAAAVIGRKIWIVGGQPADRSGIRVVDIDTKTIEDGPLLPGFAKGDHLHFVANLDGQLHVCGGFTDQAGGITDEHWTLIDGAWVQRARQPVADFGKFSVWAAVDGQLYMFSMFGMHHRYDPRTDSWTALAPMPESRLMPASYVRDGAIVVIGGRPIDRKGPVSLMSYEIDQDRWVTATEN